MTVIRCVTMQKNEATLLEPWIRWHAAIFGLSNLTVIDNGSTDPVVLDIQNRYEAQGLTVIREFPEREHFLHKGDVITRIIRRWDAGRACDFAVPLDCDEFMAVFLDQLSVDPAIILAEFERLKHEKATLLTDRLLLNVPSAPNYYGPQIVRRCLFRAGTIRSLDRGFHDPQTIHRQRYIQTAFVHIHLHNRPDYEDIRRFARQKLDPSGTGPRPVHAQDGAHLRYYFHASAKEFLNSYRHTPDLYAPVIAERFQELGLAVEPLLGTGPVPEPALNLAARFAAHRFLDTPARHEYVAFDPVFYAQANPDVMADPHYGIWPLIHFMEAGWQEGRAPNPANFPPLVLQTPPEG
ncbi:glycosyltransferase family 2 protein [Gluconobacter morbifer]|uniref:Glycosyl transferase family 2 n=1 Tax=Gluconobacter morbifer G707 TaxID=1088869 RepID=G6XJW3_9PROT|nr:glycosyltransferase family 2 protein [Gluconobacter morbifer]EHH67925.1 hypothetical protein GMO_16920 [Gluconobacter morbifer G707]